MSFEMVEKLKREYTDKWVIVDPNTAELKRFVGLSGRVKTVNMSGRALVQFDGPVDISWYDIDLSYLKLIDAPLPKKSTEKHAEAEKKPAAAAKPAAPAASGKSPLELARAQGAAGSGAAVKKSPVELAREQGAAKAAGTAPAVAAPVAAVTGDKPLSKLEQARLQGAAKAKAAAEAAAPAAAATSPVASAPVVTAPVEAAPIPAATPAVSAAMVDENGKPLSKLEMARRQGAAKPK
ncbi:MAG: hypothetical protein JWM11_7997 [Planctomycetaceae bacterium]|nr:hypothetical protein [Planctomycetaceae bacterium]